MLALLQSAALQRFCSNIEYQILIPVTEGLPWPVAHKHLARAPLLVPSLVLTHSSGPAFLLCPCIVLSPPQWIWQLLVWDLSWLTVFLPAFLVPTDLWKMLVFPGLCYTSSACALQMKFGCLKSLLRMQRVAKELTEMSWCCRLHIRCTLG